MQVDDNEKSKYYTRITLGELEKILPSVSIVFRDN